MKWEGQEESSNVEDRRGDDGGGGGGGSPLGGRSIGLGTVVVALLASWVFGINPLTALNLLSGGGGQPAPSAQHAPAHRPVPDDRASHFAKTVLADTERVWDKVFAAGRSQYVKPTLVLFRGRTGTACGAGESAMGPFYCPGDQKVYLDLGFFDTLQQRLGAPGDFAQAYVIAHEVGHHVQNLMGVTQKVDAMRGRVSQVQMNALSVKLELQADCLSGVWAFHSQAGKGWLEAGDIEEALHAASQIGDDTLQKQARGTVVPESFTHGSSAQRVSWFKRGLQAGRVADCNTFDAR